MLSQQVLQKTEVTISSFLVKLVNKIKNVLLVVFEASSLQGHCEGSVSISYISHSLYAFIAFRKGLNLHYSTFYFQIMKKKWKIYNYWTF